VKTANAGGVVIVVIVVLVVIIVVGNIGISGGIAGSICRHFFAVFGIIFIICLIDNGRRIRLGLTVLCIGRRCIYIIIISKITCFASS
jgi:hypothetical protein